MNSKTIFSYFLGFSLFSNITFAVDTDFTQLSIEQLMDTTISSVSGTAQKFSDTAASIFVITQEDIKRSGVTNIPDALRMVPGIHVARIGVGKWAVTARGNNGRLANKLLVLIDGRSVYTVYFGGTRWENLDMVLNDIERIEIIRGPGASIWGHNAVNGVINIITKHSQDTQQGLLTVTAGNEERNISEIRYGNQLNEETHYRVYGKFIYRDQSINQQEITAPDTWKQGTGGLRLDWNSGQGDRVMLKADGYHGVINDVMQLPTATPFDPPFVNNEPNSGASFQARWEHDFSVASKTRTQIYYEYFDAVDEQFGDEITHTFDIDFQHEIALSDNNLFNWGLGYRIAMDSFYQGKVAHSLPVHKNLHLVSGFLQDKISLFNDRLQLTLGTKIQYFTFSGWNYQPSARLLWKAANEHHLWTSFSRAIRSPTRGETSLSLTPIPLSTHSSETIQLKANPSLQPDTVYNYELGYRTWFANRFSFDLVAFYNHYDHVVNGYFRPSEIVEQQTIVSFVNGATAQTWGFETVADWRPFDNLRLLATYSFLQFSVRDHINSPSRNRARENPKNKFSFHLSYDISKNVNMDAMVRYVDHFFVRDIILGSIREIDSYVGLDLRVSWKPLKNLQLSLVGQNINDDAHMEYIDEAFGYPRQVERSFFGQIQLQF